MTQLYARPSRRPPWHSPRALLTESPPPLTENPRWGASLTQRTRSPRGNPTEVLAEPVTDRLMLAPQARQARLAQHARQVEQALTAHGQTALLAQVSGWEPEARLRFFTDLAEVDLAGLTDAFRRASRAASRSRSDSPRALLEPAPVRTLDPRERELLRERGEAALRDGAVAALVVAGGQGTRLGLEGPKGALPIGPVSGRSLLAHHAAQIRGAAARSAAAIPWLVMTSPATDLPTRRIFERSQNFGLPSEDVIFLCQQELPCLDFEGNLMVESPGRLARSPDGHGGVFDVLARSGALEPLRQRGVRLLSYFQVDNPLLPVVDPVAIGCHLDAGVEWTLKVTRKERPDEKLGSCVRGDGARRLRIVEYTELGEPERSQQLPDGSLQIGAGAIGAHVLDLGFVRRLVEGGAALPLHLSPKGIPVWDPKRDATGPLPAAPNGFKLERFVFDALPWARSAQALEVDRADEYAPVKNPSGEHSPASARAALEARHRRWLAAADITVGTGAIEIDLARWPDAAALRGAGIHSASEAGEGILLGKGAES